MDVGVLSLNAQHEGASPAASTSENASRLGSDSADAMPTSDSNSNEQVSAERLILEQVAKRVGVGLRPRRLYLTNGAYVDVDGVAEDESVLVEVFAHQGVLKGGQRHKIATDILKLITIAQERSPRPRLVVAFADPGLATWAAGKSWLAAAIASWRIDVFTADLDDSIRAGIREAQARQIMVNPGH